MTSSIMSILKQFKVSLALMLALLMLITSLFLPGASPLFAQSSDQQAIVQGPGGGAVEFHVVQRGETLSGIARRYNTTVQVLLNLNPQITNPNRIRVGQSIVVPSQSGGPGGPGDPGGITLIRTYLIGLNTGGPIGCGDSAVSITQEIPATRAPLRAAMEALLALPSPFFAHTNYYNALQNSRLTLRDARIDNRVATIQLSGRVVLGGVCDGPRVQAQLEHTALQFSTVDQVRIFLNGRPLQEVLR